MQTPLHDTLGVGAAAHRELWFHLEHHHLWRSPHRQLRSDTGPCLARTGT